jgi:chorismate mutase/catechol 2,3-dioxygenase-like lactoylglutathione lyase family enzyme
MIAMTRSLAELRSEIDSCDRELLEVLARRFAAVHEVAEVKGASATQVIAPDRVREVLATRGGWARELSIDERFADLLFRLLLGEAHRVEAVSLRTGSREVSPSTAPIVASALQTAACRIDHVSVVVDDLDAATEWFVNGLGFAVVEPRTEHVDHPGLHCAVVDAGGVTLVLVESAPDRDGGPLPNGVHHLALEVLNAAYLRDDLLARNTAVQTDVLIKDNGLERFFAVRDASSGLQLGFVSRVGERSVFDGGDVVALSAAIDDV